MAQTSTPAFIVTPDTALADGMAEPLAFTFNTSRNKFRDHGHGPQVVADIFNMAAFSQNNGKPIRCDNLVVKLPNSTLLRIPEAYAQFSEAIEKIAAYEAKHSQTFPYRMARLTIRRWEIKPGERQDSIEGGWHFDRRGIDASEVPFEDSIYVISDRDGTLAQAKPLRDVFKQLDGTDKPVEGLSVQAQPGQIVRMTNNTRHRSAPSRAGGWRTFLRLTFESPPRKLMEALPVAERRRLGLNF